MLYDDPFLALPDLSEEKVARLPRSAAGWGTILRQYGPYKRMAVGAGLGAAKSMLSNDDEGVVGGAARGAMLGAVIPTGMIGKSMGGKSPGEMRQIREGLAEAAKQRAAVRRPGSPPETASTGAATVAGQQTAATPTPQDVAASTLRDVRGNQIRTPGVAGSRPGASRERALESIVEQQRKSSSLGGLWFP